MITRINSSLNSISYISYLLSLVIQLDQHPTGQKVPGKVQEVRVVEKNQKLAQLSRHGLSQHGCRRISDKDDRSLTRQSGLLLAVTDYAPESSRARNICLFPSRYRMHVTVWNHWHTLDRTWSTPITLHMLCNVSLCKTSRESSLDQPSFSRWNDRVHPHFHFPRESARGEFSNGTKLINDHSAT